MKAKIKPTISDIAKIAGVDKSTVSIVLNDTPLSKRIKQSTKERIIKAASQLNYHPSFMARSLYFGKTKSIGIVVGDIARAYFAELTAMALDAVHAKGYQALISATQWEFEREGDSLKNLFDRQVDGIIFFPGGISTHKKLYQRILEARFPVVVYDYPDENLSSVVSDYAPGIEKALKLFAERDHRKVLYLGASIEWNGKQKALDDLSRKYKLEVEKYLYPDHSSTVLENFADMISRTASPQAVIVSDDESALILLGLLRDRGCAVPSDCDVIGIDGISLGAHFRPALTSINQDCKKLMTAAVDMIVEMSANNLWKPKSIIVPTELLVRDTVRV